ncbi:MAG: hypothetical protein ACFB4I_12125 [Cyanophyceae cyanobacterium]
MTLPTPLNLNHHCFIFIQPRPRLAAGDGPPWPLSEEELAQSQS